MFVYLTFTLQSAHIAFGVAQSTKTECEEAEMDFSGEQLEWEFN
jgi:heat shock protein HslJ